MAKIQSKANPVWLRPTLPPLPTTAAGVRNAVISLNGTWKINVRPPDRFWTDAVDPASWIDTEVPGYTVTQGLEIEREPGVRLSNTGRHPRRFRRPAHPAAL